MIYLVDDAPDYRFLVAQVFKLFLPQYPLLLFADGLELIHHIEQAADAADPVRPQVILLDVDMPRLDGLQTLERLKQITGWQTIPVVMISNRADGHFVAPCYDRGASSFLVKPMSLDQLKTMMTLLCQYWVGLNQLPQPRAEWR